MDLSPSQIFCDKIVCSQYHAHGHSPVFGRVSTSIDESGELSPPFYHPKTLLGEFGSSVQISSNGHLVTFDGNPSRWNRPDNVHGLPLDEAKGIVNQILMANGLPPFHGVNLKFRQAEENRNHLVVTDGAVFSRIDMTTNVITGSPSNLQAFLRYHKTQSFPRLEQRIYGNNTYHGKDSDSRQFLIYDKGLDAKNKLLKNAENPAYINQIIDYLQSNGVARLEMSYKRFLRKQHRRFWNAATTKSLNKQFTKDFNIMAKDIETPDYGDMPGEVLKTLALYMIGANPKEVLANNTYYKHKKILKTYGYDISNPNIHLVQGKLKIISLQPCVMPDWYRHADTSLLKAVK